MKTTISLRKRIEPGQSIFSTETVPIMEHPACVGIFNQKGSGVKVKIREANLRPMTATQALISKIKVQRISSITGGEPLTPFKLDSANNDMPVQIVSVLNPESVVSVANIRSNMIMTQMNMVRPLANMVSRLTGNSRAGADMGEFITFMGDTVYQGIRLNEGEGLALTFIENSPSFEFGCSVLLIDLDTNQSYRFSDTIESRFMSGTTFWAILNGVGSGKHYSIKRIQIREVGTDDIPIASYEQIERMDEDAVDAPYILMDSSQALHAGVLIKENCNTMRSGSRGGALISYPSMRRVTPAEPPWGPGITAGPQIARRGIFSTDFNMGGIGGESEIVLGEGQGFALFLRTPSAQFFHEFTALIIIEEPDEVIGGGGGARSFAF